MHGFHVSLQSDGVAHIDMKMAGKVNTINATFGEHFSKAFDEARALKGVKGIVITSSHRDFCVGADIHMVYTQTDPAEVFALCQGLNALLRSLELSGLPVVAALTGSTLGGGYELALACHHRVALNDPRIQIGLPEVALGLIPGAGGTQRLPYIIGLQAAIEHIGLASPLRAPKAHAKGFVHELGDSREDVLEKAHAFIHANPKPSQPWDQKRPQWPGGVRPNTPAAAQLIVGASAFLIKKTAGAFDAPQLALRAIADGTRINFDRGLEIESRFFAKLATSPQSKDMTRTLWFHRNAAEKLGVGLDHGFSKVTILGAGMMGAGLGFLCAKAGLQVVIKDIHQAALDTAETHNAKNIKKLRHLSSDDQAALQARITYTLELDPVRGSDLVIEAIVENLDIKKATIREIEPLLAPNAVFASNTSAIPIALLAEAAEHKDRFIGLHFFSPVEKMPLLEVIQPPTCSKETLERCLGFGKAIKKTNIVVNDGYGFFTTRLFSAYILEGCQLLNEGHDPALIEYAAQTLGMVMPPLKVFDEVTLTLGVHAFATRKTITGEDFDHGGLDLVRKLVSLGRTGKAAGKGFYDWESRTIWNGLRDLVDATPKTTGLAHLQRRIMLAQIAEVGRVLSDGIIRDLKDVEIGAIYGLGFAPNTGGPLAWIDRQPLSTLLPEMEAFAKEYGPRYAPSPALSERTEPFWKGV